MGIRNYLIAGGSGTGKTAVAEELQRRGYHAVHGDRVLCYHGDPGTGERVEEPIHDNDMGKALWLSEHHLWDIEKVQSLTADHGNDISFFCGSCRNFELFDDVFDGIFILAVESVDTLLRRIEERVARDPTDWGGKPEEVEIVLKMHTAKEGLPKEGIIIDATAPLVTVVDEILFKCSDRRP